MAFVQYIVLKILQAGQQGGKLPISGDFTMAFWQGVAPG